MNPYAQPALTTITIDGGKAVTRFFHVPTMRITQVHILRMLSIAMCIVIGFFISFADLSVALGAEMQIPGSRVMLDVAADFVAADRALESTRLRALIRAIDYPDDLQDWERKLRNMAKANRRGTLARTDSYIYYYYHWPRSSADFNVILRTEKGTVHVIYEVRAAALESGSITVADIEQSLTSARLVPDQPSTK